jgi:hypothetical protein
MKPFRWRGRESTGERMLAEELGLESRSQENAGFVIVLVVD